MLDALRISASMISLFQRASFWADYFWLRQAETTCNEKHEQPPARLDNPIVFPFPADYSLILDIASEINLSLFHPSVRSPIELGWDDEAHWHPFALRWEELETLCRCLAAGDSKLTHPGWPLLLLCRFAPITKDDDYETARQNIMLALERTHPSILGLSEQVLELVDRSDDDVAWRRASDGHWSCEGDDAYSLRVEGNPKFPFELLRDLIEHAREIGCPDSEQPDH
jgi:hypothetical protein